MLSKHIFQSKSSIFVKIPNILHLTSDSIHEFWFYLNPTPLYLNSFRNFRSNIEHLFPKIWFFNEILICIHNSSFSDVLQSSFGPSCNNNCGHFSIAWTFRETRNTFFVSKNVGNFTHKFSFFPCFLFFNFFFAWFEIMRFNNVFQNSLLVNCLVLSRKRYFLKF